MGTKEAKNLHPVFAFCATQAKFFDPVVIRLLQIAFEFDSIKATKDGFSVSFTKAVPKDQLENLSNWAIDAWTYKPVATYGGRKIDIHSADATKVVVSADRKSVELTVPNRKPNYVYHIRTDPTSDDGEAMWSPEAWFTFHNAPAK